MAMARLDAAQEVTAQNVGEESLNVVRGGVVIRVLAEKGVEWLPVGASEAFPSGQ